MERGTKAEIPFSNHWVYRDGELTCDGVRLTELAERFGTPTYVYSGNQIDRAYDRMRDAVPDNTLIAYAIKLVILSKSRRPRNRHTPCLKRSCNGVMTSP